MKKLSLVLFINLGIFLSSCENKKAKLVTMQKQIKDSLNKVDNSYRTNVLIRSVIMKDSFDKIHPDLRRFNMLDDEIKMDTLSYKLQDKEMRHLDSLHFVLRDLYDSLEFEIKKF